MAKPNQTFLDGGTKSSFKAIKLKLKLKAKTQKNKKNKTQFFSFSIPHLLTGFEPNPNSDVYFTYFETIQIHFETHWFETQLTNLNPFWIQMTWCGGGMVGTISRLETNLKERDNF